MLAIAICEENTEFLKEMAERILSLVNIKGATCKIDSFLSIKELQNAHQKGTRFDMIFLNIKMKEYPQIEEILKIREKDSQAVLIYISEEIDNLKELIEVNPFGLIRHPINPQELMTVMERAYSKITQEHTNFEFYFNHQYYRMPIRDIMYFTSKGRIVALAMQQGIEKFYGKLDDVEDTMSSFHAPFLRIHQSYLINYQFILKMTYTKVVMQNLIELPISEDRQKAIRDKFKKYWKTI